MEQLSTSLVPPPRKAVAHDDAGRLRQLLQRVESGEPVDVAAVEALTHSPERATRGLAKRLLAVILVNDARRSAARLLGEACDDLDFRYPVVLDEAIGHAEQLEQFDRIFDLRVCAASHAAARGEYVPALVHLLNAGAMDFRHNARCINNPERIARMMSVYQVVADRAAADLDIRPAPRNARRSPSNARLRLAHVVGQLVDGGHSTSRAVDTFLRHADRERFDVYLFVSDALGRHAQHSGQVVASDWSANRAPQRIARYQQQLGVPVILPRSRDSFLTAAADLHRRMADLQIDIAFFHGSIAMPTDWLLCAWNAAPWQFDRAFGIPLHCPHVSYQFFEFAATMEKLAFWCRQRGIAYGPLRFGGADLSYVIEAQPIPRDALGVPAGHLLLATVGNHLPSRMSDAFCRTVAGVLRANPNTTYLVIGPGQFERQRALFGNLAGAGPHEGRVRFIGPSSITERVAQTIDIYLNEYPDGGGVAIGEAMAAGKAVVCMQADDSALAMAGAFYVGPENLVRPATDDAYAARLSTLIKDPAERQRCAAALRARYDAELDGRKLTQDETERIWQVVHGLPATGIRQ